MRARIARAVAAFVGFCLATSGLAAVGTVIANRPSPAAWAVSLLSLAVLAGATAFCAHRLIVNLSGRSSAAAYRLAFLIGAATAAAMLAAQGGPTPWFLPLTFLMLGAFGGGLVASSRDHGLWEDNSPPPAEVMRWVLEIHQARLPPEGRMPRGKRLLDVAVSGAGLLVLCPLTIVVCWLLWLENPGPLFFVKNSVGRGGRNFRQWKLRTMVLGAEAESGPVWAEQADQRVLHIGRLLRKTALDELPQLVNILVGQMSVVGPRPQRTVLVAEYLRRLPAYADRHRLAPGLAGLAQVAGHYYITPRQKLRFDRVYLDHAGLGFDLRLMLIAFAVVFWLRWRRGWKGRVPRSWLHGWRRDLSDSATLAKHP